MRNIWRNYVYLPRFRVSQDWALRLNTPFLTFELFSQETEYDSQLFNTKFRKNRIEIGELQVEFQ